MPSQSDLRLENAVVRKLENKPLEEASIAPRLNAYEILDKAIDDLLEEDGDDKPLKLVQVRGLNTLKGARNHLVLHSLFARLDNIIKQIKK